ncbi:MAG: hypothetical protein JJV97_03945 [SAR324 cluster bacterium]|nr:hypothetical protein [SAR324 cluster bacterium]
MSKLINIVKFILRNNLAHKLSAIALALMVWAIFSHQESRGGFVIFPIQIVYADIPEHTIVTSELLDSVNVTFKLRGDYKVVTKDDFKLVVPMADMSIGKNKFKISANHIIGPESEVLYIEPELLHIKLEQLIMKMITIVPKLDRPDNRLRSKIQIVPSQIVISGPKNLITKINKISTSTIEINSLKKGVELKASLDLPRYVSANGQESIIVQLLE